MQHHFLLGTTKGKINSVLDVDLEENLLTSTINSLLKSLYLIIYNKKYLNILRKNNITIFVLNSFTKRTIKELNVPDNKVKIFYNPISFVKTTI